MDGLPIFDIALFTAGTFGAAFVTGLAGFAFGIVAAAIWLHVLSPAQTAPQIVAFAPDKADREIAESPVTQLARSPFRSGAHSRQAATRAAALHGRRASSVAARPRGQTRRYGNAFRSANVSFHRSMLIARGRIRACLNRVQTLGESDVLSSKTVASMMPDMRTTLTLDDDLAGLLKQRARELGIPFKEAVNRTIRAGIGEAVATRGHPAPKTISHSFGFRPGIDPDKLGQLADELEAEAFAEKMHDSARRKRPRSRAQR